MKNKHYKGECPVSKNPSLQDPFLNSLRKERIPVSIYLVNGIKLQGQVESFDQFVVLLKNNVSQMVYKHAISTIVPARSVSMKPHSGAPQGGAPISHDINDEDLDEDEEDFTQPEGI